LAPARAVLAPAVARTIEATHRQADFTHRRAHVEAPLVGAEAARATREAQRRHARRVFGVERDHAAGGIAEQCREWPTQDIDACRGTEFEGPGLPLAIGHRQRDAVLDQAHAANPEGSASAEAARGNLEVLGIVVA